MNFKNCEYSLYFKENIQGDGSRTAKEEQKHRSTVPSVSVSAAAVLFRLFQTDSDRF